MSGRSLSKSLFTGLTALVVGLCSVPGWAANGTWITTSAGTFNWDDAANWTSNVIADGAGFTATIGAAGAANPSGTIINLNSAHTIGNLVFNSRASGASSWTLGGSNTLTLDNTGGIGGPMITLNAPVPAQTITLNAPLAGTSGFTVAGTGNLVIGSAYAGGFMGPTIINSALNNTAILTYAADNPNVKGIQIGTLTTTGMDATLVNTASLTTATINVNANVAATSFVAQTNSGAGGTSNAPVVSSQVNIAPTKTLTINGPFTVGYDTGPGNTSVAPQTDVVFTGNALNVQAPGQIFAVGPNNQGTVNTISILD